MIKSAYFSAVDRAALMLRVWESGTTPFPIGVGKNGIPVISTSFLTYFYALPYAQPFPTIIKGLLCADIRLIAVSISWWWGADLLGKLKRGCSIGDSTIAVKTSPGRSRNTGPGLPVIEALTALWTW